MQGISLLDGVMTFFVRRSIVLLHPLRRVQAQTGWPLIASRLLSSADLTEGQEFRAFQTVTGQDMRQSMTLSQPKSTLSGGLQVQYNSRLWNATRLYLVGATRLIEVHYERIRHRRSDCGQCNLADLLLPRGYRQFSGKQTFPAHLLMELPTRQFSNICL